MGCAFSFRKLEPAMFLKLLQSSASKDVGAPKIWQLTVKKHHTITSLENMAVSKKSNPFLHIPLIVSQALAD